MNDTNPAPTRMLRFLSACDAVDARLREMGIPPETLESPTSTAKAIATHYNDDLLLKLVAAADATAAALEAGSC